MLAAAAALGGGLRGKMPLFQIPGRQAQVAAQQELHVRLLRRQSEYLRVEVVLVAVADEYQQGLVRQGRDRLLPPVEQQAEGVQLYEEAVVG